jgi:uncharacterized protein (TIGR00369 family)
MTDYPPDQHLLRDLRFSFDHDNDGRRSRAWMPVVAECCTDVGSARAGALATLVDVIGGGLAATTAAPNWIATADLTLHLTRAAVPGTVVEARAQVLRAGRTTVVIEVGLLDHCELDVGIATMSFSVLPRRDVNPDMDSVRGGGPSSMALPESRLERPLLDELGVIVHHAAKGVVELPVRDWSRNSMGAMQGGVVATVVDAAGEAALRAATGESLVVTDMQLTYVGFGRVGPVRSCAEVLGTGPGYGSARVDLVDAGAEDRQMTVARVAATRALA